MALLSWSSHRSDVIRIFSITSICMYISQAVPQQASYEIVASSCLAKPLDADDSCLPMTPEQAPSLLQQRSTKSPRSPDVHSEQDSVDDDEENAQFRAITKHKKTLNEAQKVPNVIKRVIADLARHAREAVDTLAEQKKSSRAVIPDDTKDENQEIARLPARADEESAQADLYESLGKAASEALQNELESSRDSSWTSERDEEHIRKTLGREAHTKKKHEALQNEARRKEVEENLKGRAEHSRRTKERFPGRASREGESSWQSEEIMGEAEEAKNVERFRRSGQYRPRAEGTDAEERARHSELKRASIEELDVEESLDVDNEKLGADDRVQQSEQDVPLADEAPITVKKLGWSGRDRPQTDEVAEEEERIRRAEEDLEEPVVVTRTRKSRQDRSRFEEAVPEVLGDSCTPTCTWSCESQKCDQVCSPVCKAPMCETRCAGMSFDGCVMDCAKPQCVVMCPPKSLCATGNCPSCTTQCSEPQCKMKCPPSNLCRSICEEPQCEWSCKAPTSCPKPECQMLCESPKKCGRYNFTKQLPPLSPGESAVQTFAAFVPEKRRHTKKQMSTDPIDQQDMDLPVATRMSVRVISLPFAESSDDEEPKASFLQIPVRHETH